VEAVKYSLTAVSFTPTPRIRWVKTVIGGLCSVTARVRSRLLATTSRRSFNEQPYN